MSLHVILRYNSPSTDVTVFGAITIFRGSRLADALTYLRALAREGLRSESDVDAEATILIRNSNQGEPK